MLKYILVGGDGGGYTRVYRTRSLSSTSIE